MRLTPEHIQAIRVGVVQLAGPTARVWLFGSRVYDHLRGGDVDLLLELDEPIDDPARLAARVSGRVSRAIYGRKVDVVVKAPNLGHLPIHSIALKEGVLL